MKQYDNTEYWSIITRCSTEEQSIDGYSIETQIAECNKKFNEIPNTSLYKIYSDEGLSGSDSYINRPELLNMLADAKAKKFKGLIIWKADRLGRLADEREQIILMLHKYGIKIICCSGENLMDNSPQGKFTRKTLANVDELEVGVLAMRIKGTMNTIISNGEWKGGAIPYSYSWAREDKSKKSPGKMIPISEEQLEQVKKIYELYVFNLMGFNSIRDYMNNNDYPYYKNGEKQKFNKDHIKTILKCPLYCGHQYNNNVYTKFEPKEDGKKHKPKEEWEIYPVNFIEPIISKEIFDMAQDIMQKKANKTMTITKTTWLLTGLFTCKHCGSPMYGHPLRTKYTRKKDGQKVEYDCSSYNCTGTQQYGREYCKIKQTSKKLTEEKIIEYTIDYIDTLLKYVSKEMMEDITKKTKKLNKTNQTKLLSIDKELDKIDKGLKRAIKDYQDGELKTQAYNLVSEDFINRRILLEKERQEIIDSIENQPDIKDELNKLLSWLEKWKKTLHNIDYYQPESIMMAKATLIQLIKYIKWDGEELDVKFKISKELIEFICKEVGRGTGQPTQTHSKINAIQNLFKEDINNVFNSINMRRRLVVAGE